MISNILFNDLRRIIEYHCKINMNKILGVALSLMHVRMYKSTLENDLCMHKKQLKFTGRSRTGHISISHNQVKW